MCEVSHNLDHDFRTLYSTTGRPSIPSEQLLSTLQQVFYGVRSERQLMDGLSPDVGWDATTCTKHRERLRQGDLFNPFMETLLQHKDVTALLSDKHFSVNSTLIEALAGHKIFTPNDDTDSDGEHFHGTTRKNDTRASTTNPDSCLSRKSEGKEQTLRDMRHATMENRNGLAVKGTVTQATGTAEREASEDMLAENASATQSITAGMDKAYDVKEHVERLHVKNTHHLSRRAPQQETRH